MAETGAAVTTVLLWILTLTECQDTPITCLFSEACVLPCSFRRSGEEVIHWQTLAGQVITVHSYYYGNDQLKHQNGTYKGRTSLFKDLISHGNASLLLRNTSIQDQGRYKCYTSTTLGNQESFVSLRVEAPIKSVSMERTSEGVTCMSQGIYPSPRVSWSTDPPTPSGTLQDSSQPTADAQGLFSVNSTVRMLGNLSDHAYVCSVSKEDGTGEWRASFRQQEDIHGEVGQTLAIPCPVPKPSLFTQTWTFMGQTPPILTHNSATSHQDISDLWKNRVQDLLETGSLLIQDPEGQNLTGTYTCKVSADRTLQLVQTYVSFTGADKHSGSDTRLPAAVAVPVVIIALLMIVLLIVACKKGWLRGSKCQNGQNDENRHREAGGDERMPLSSMNGGRGVGTETGGQNDEQPVNSNNGGVGT
ncbi:hypothetical protein MATL_G00022090 [Megalops atlanticus]|uniref:Ig-like domain-containing protein n=1 Tax=Megalops atlanticus TaxID=7932 RepID=A0A9D3QB85_MEGAT|nr:hypothetical protein MATL_G00022090 [Megalops atlanticus]